jgi:hypothetical protein
VGIKAGLKGWKSVFFQKFFNFDQDSAISLSLALSVQTEQANFSLVIVFL